MDSSGDHANLSSKVQFTPTDNAANVKIDVSSASDSSPSRLRGGGGSSAQRNQRVGFTKDELMKYANQPFWSRFRTFLFATFWVVWLSILVAAITIVWASGGCQPKVSGSPMTTSAAFVDNLTLK